MTIPEPSEYWSLWPFPPVALELWGREAESADDRNKLIDVLEDLRDEANLQAIDLDSVAMGFWMLSESERRTWMGVFFEHVHRNPLDSLFGDQLFNSLELPPTFDGRHEFFIREKALYSPEESRLILQLMEAGHATVHQDEDWRYRVETIEYWTLRSDPA